MDLSIVLSLGGGKAVKKRDKIGNHFSIHNPYQHNLMDLSIVLSLDGGKAVKKRDKFGNHFSIKCLRQPRQLRKRRVYSIRDKQR